MLHSTSCTLGPGQRHICKALMHLLLLLLLLLCRRAS
jgi:hypothetical protein